jgi:hypothetical protein
MWLLRLVWLVIVCGLGYSWFGGWGLILALLASIHFGHTTEYVEVERPTGKTPPDPHTDYDPGYKGGIGV